MSVDGSLDESGGSIPMDRLKQFVEEDTWYFSDGDSGDDSDSDNGESPDDSLLPKEVMNEVYYILGERSDNYGMFIIMYRVIG